MGRDPDPPIDNRTPNAAEQTLVRFAQERAKRAGIPWKDVIEKADISRSTEWRLRTGKGSVASLRAIELKLAEIEEEKGLDAAESMVSRLQAWTAIGAELLMLDDSGATFNALLSRVRDAMEKASAAAEAMSALTHPLPRNDK